MKADIPVRRKMLLVPRKQHFGNPVLRKDIKVSQAKEEEEEELRRSLDLLLVLINGNSRI